MLDITARKARLAALVTGELSCFGCSVTRPRYCARRGEAGDSETADLQGNGEARSLGSSLCACLTGRFAARRGSEPTLVGPGPNCGPCDC